MLLAVSSPQQWSASIRGPCHAGQLRMIPNPGVDLLPMGSRAGNELQRGPLRQRACGDQIVHGVPGSWTPRVDSLQRRRSGTAPQIGKDQCGQRLAATFVPEGRLRVRTGSVMRIGVVDEPIEDVAVLLTRSHDLIRPFVLRRLLHALVVDEAQEDMAQEPISVLRETARSPRPLPRLCLGFGEDAAQEHRPMRAAHRGRDGTRPGRCPPPPGPTGRLRSS